MKLTETHHFCISKALLSNYFFYFFFSSWLTELNTYQGNSEATVIDNFDYTNIVMQILKFLNLHTGSLIQRGGRGVRIPVQGPLV